MIDLFIVKVTCYSLFVYKMFVGALFLLLNCVFLSVWYILLNCRTMYMRGSRVGTGSPPWKITPSTDAIISPPAKCH